jgi:hypothetical protein
MLQWYGTITASATMLGRLMPATRMNIDARRVGECNSANPTSRN